MASRMHLTSIEDVPEDGSFLFTALAGDGTKEEVLVVRCDDGVEAWLNFCQHEADQRLDRGDGAAIRNGEIVCPKHGSMFDTCSGYCDNGKAKDSRLVDVSVALEDGDVYLTDDAYTYLRDGGLRGDDEAPGSSSHLTY